MKVISRVIALFPGEIYLGGFASFGDVGEPFGWNPLFPGPYGRILPGVTNHFFSAWPVCLIVLGVMYQWGLLGEARR